MCNDLAKDVYLVLLKVQSGNSQDFLSKFVRFFVTWAKVQSSGYRIRQAIGRLWVQIFSNTILDGNGVKAMPGSIPTPNPGSFNN
jgi:hypothetical protein